MNFITKSKNIIRKIFKMSTLLSDDSNFIYFDSPSENLSSSHINLDMRNPLANTKYIAIGKNCSINANCVFETETGYIQIGNRVFIGGGKSLQETELQ